MPRSVTARRADFRHLHESGCFALPNPWDAGSARMLQHLGFKAVASTSSGYAWSTGRPDHGIPREEMLAHLTSLCAAIDLPVNADFESGFAADAAAVAESVALAVETGVAGLSIEDHDRQTKGRLYDLPTAVERVRAARRAIDRSGHDVILVARTEGLIADPAALKPAIDKLVAFADAGADCLYAPGVKDKGAIATIVRAVAPKPVNVLALRPWMTLTELADLGVRRVSIGGALARVAWRAMIGAAEQMKAGSFEGLDDAIAGTEINEIFGTFPSDFRDS
jgi:2-methylisocitrate lyase-like PEP mutase family enzyme